MDRGVLVLADSESLGSNLLEANFRNLFFFLFLKYHFYSLFYRCGAYS